MELVFVSRDCLVRKGIQAMIHESDLLFDGIVLFSSVQRAVEHLARVDGAGLLLDDQHERLMEMGQLMAGLQQNHPNVPIVILSNRLSGEYIWQMIQGGVKGYVYRNDASDYLLHCLETAMFRDLLSLSPGVEGVLRAVDISLNNGMIKPYDLKVLRMLTQGASNVEIAVALTMSTRTVGRAKERLMSLLGVETPNLIVDAARRKGLI